MEILFQILGQYLPLVVIFSCWIFSKRNDNRILTYLREEEPKYADIQILNTKEMPKNLDAIDSSLCTTQVVLAVDPGKQFVAWILTMVGGNIDVYQKMLHLARRKAKLNIRKQARENGANLVLKYSVETSNIFAGSGNSEGGSSGAVEVFAYGTAIKQG